MYLILKCRGFLDDREPVCLTIDYSKYGEGYEVYKVLQNGTFKLIKEYNKTNLTISEMVKALK